MSLYAWSHGLTPGEAVSAASMFPGLGLVLNRQNISAAGSLEQPSIAYVTDVGTARRISDMIDAGVSFRAVLVNDERNQTGPSGAYMKPDDYATHFASIEEILGWKARISTMGLAPVGGWLRRLSWRMKFDRDYHAQLPHAEIRAFNPNKVGIGEVRKTLNDYPGPWILSPAPFRGFWDQLFQPVSVHEWAKVADSDQVVAVAFWCLKEAWGGPFFNERWQTEHGLLDRDWNITSVGKEVLRELGT